MRREKIAEGWARVRAGTPSGTGGWLGSGGSGGQRKQRADWDSFEDIPNGTCQWIRQMSP